VVAENFEKEALRTIALAYREVAEKDSFGAKEVEQELVFPGFAGMIDPPRSRKERILTLRTLLRSYGFI
jgi:magnesium-transporting ATPase (P-type)